jgi:hypothetical protein
MEPHLALAGIGCTLYSDVPCDESGTNGRRIPFKEL